MEWRTPELRFFSQRCWHRKAFKTQSDESITMYNVLLDSMLICSFQQSCEIEGKAPVLNSILKIGDQGSERLRSIQDGK